MSVSLTPSVPVLSWSHHSDGKLMDDLILDALFDVALRNDRPPFEPYGIRLATETADHRQRFVTLTADLPAPALGDLVRAFCVRHDAEWAVLGVESWSTPLESDDHRRRADGSLRADDEVRSLSSRERRRCLILVGERRGEQQVRRAYWLDPDPIRGADLLYTQPVSAAGLSVAWPAVGTLIPRDDDAQRVYRRVRLGATRSA